MRSRFQDKVCVVTGAGSGIGAATAIRLAGEGATVVAVDLNPGLLDTTASHMRSMDLDVTPLAADISVEREVDSMVAATLEQHGRIDVLHNNAAATDADTIGRDGDLLSTDLDIWRRALEVNLMGAVHCCRAVLPGMIERRSGSIVNTLSGAALSGNYDFSAYSASKAALLQLTRDVATQYGAMGIRCNAIAPGLVLTPASKAHLPQWRLEGSIGRNLVPWLGEPEDIAATVAFLASDDARYVTGEVVRVDGGCLSHAPPQPTVPPSASGS